MSDEELDKNHDEIINNSLGKLESLLQEIETLDPVIRENQIRRFKNHWNYAFKQGLKPNEILKSKDFRENCKYVFNRINGENRIEQRIGELYSSTILELQRTR